MSDKLIYYTLIWNSKKNYSVKITNKEIIDAEYYIDTVTLRKSKFIVKIYGKIKDNNKLIIADNIENKGFSNIPLLKSNLQKCIRRGLTDKAIVTAYNLIQKDFWSFIRRIIIISIEDVSVLENIPFLSWCLIAYPNFNLTNEIIQYLLLTVFSLCLFKKKINIKKNGKIIEDYINFKNDPLKFGYLIRMEYGGLKGDMAMINTLLSKKIKNNHIVRVSLKNLIITRNINRQDIINPSIDFHINSKIIDYVSKKSEIKNYDTIKKTIWNHCSSINFRENLKEKKLRKEWDKIKYILEGFYKEFKIY